MSQERPGRLRPGCPGKRAVRLYDGHFHHLAFYGISQSHLTSLKTSCPGFYPGQALSYTFPAAAQSIDRSVLAHRRLTLQIMQNLA